MAHLWAPKMDCVESWGIMGNYGGLWGLMGNYGVLWGFVVFHGVLWGIMGNCGELWGFMGNYGELWGNIWIRVQHKSGRHSFTWLHVKWPRVAEHLMSCFFMTLAR